MIDNPLLKFKTHYWGYCSHCQGVRSIADACVVLEGDCFLIKGNCVDCHGPVARYVEDIGKAK